ncbi:MAG: 50S ribosomal protein L4 [Patescibacteria group bacterium]
MSLQASVYNQKGEVVGNQELKAGVWGVAVNTGLIHEALRVKQASKRMPIANTKTRGEVRGGGKKPWKQKGTGRARVGSTRSPIWVGGGKAFGPRKERNFFLRMNKKANRKALLMCLSDKVTTQSLVIVDTFETLPKSKALALALSRLPLEGKKILLALTEQEKIVARSARNLSRVAAISTKSLNVEDILKAKVLVISKNGVGEVETVYGAK